MVSRIVFILVVSGLLIDQGAFRPSAARTVDVFDVTVTGISSESERSGQNSEVDESYQQNLKSTGCKGGTCATFAVQSTSSRSPENNRVLMDSSVLRGRRLADDTPVPPGSNSGSRETPIGDPSPPGKNG